MDDDNMLLERTLACINFVLLAVIVIRQTIWFTIGI
jgi:hypothetical protein